MLSSGEGNSTPLQYSCLENPTDGGAWWATQSMGVTKSRTRLSDFTFTFRFHALEKKMATHSSVLALRIPGMGESGGLPSMGSHRVRHDWSDLAAAAAGYLLKGKKVWFQIWNEPGQSSHFVHIKNLRLYMKTVITQSSPWIKKLKTNDCLFKNKKLTRQLLSYATHMLNIFAQNRKLLLQKYLKFIPHYLGYLTCVLRLTTSNGSSWKWFLSKLNHCLKMTG